MRRLIKIYSNKDPRIIFMALFLSLLLALPVSAVVDASHIWSDWYQLDDGALNGIFFSWRSIGDKQEWRWRNDYTGKVKIKYKLRYISNGTNGKIKEGTTPLESGENELKEFSIAASSLEGMTVVLVEPKFKGPRPKIAPPSSTAEVDAEKAQRLKEKNERNFREQKVRADNERIVLAQIQERNLQEQRRKAEEEANQQAAMQQQLLEYQYQLDAEERREERKQQQREEEKRQEREEKRQEALEARRQAEDNRQYEQQRERNFNQALNNGLSSFQSSINQGAATLNNATQANRAATDYARQQREERARQAAESQRTRQEDANRQARQLQQKQQQERIAQQQRENERNQREQVALERSQKVEQDRQQALADQRKQEEQKQEQQSAGTTAQVVTVPIADSCVRLLVSPDKIRIIKNNCSYTIHVSFCSNDNNFGYGSTPVGGNSSTSTGISSTANFQFAACPFDEPQVSLPIDTRTGTIIGETCNRTTGSFASTGYVCKKQY